MIDAPAAPNLLTKEYPRMVAPSSLAKVGLDLGN
jgi:hypothetical protein